MSITHIVLFKFKDSASADTIQDVCNRMLNLQHQCIHPTSNEPYIVSAKGGRDNSSEGMQQGITHGFVVEFKSAEDRDYYVESDPAHSRFKASLKDIVTKAQVVDFAPNTY